MKALIIFLLVGAAWCKPSNAPNSDFKIVPMAEVGSLGNQTDEDARQGDEVFPVGDGGANRNALRHGDKRIWDTKKIPVTFAPEITSEYQKLIKEVHAEIAQKTCLDFEYPTTAPARPYLHYIDHAPSRPGCNSPVGMVPMGDGPDRNAVTIQLERPHQMPGGGVGTCMTHAIAMHETFHALGLDHEQNRFDRDQYLDVRVYNVKSGMEHNFKKGTADNTDTYNVPYDYTSVMHYGGTAFTKNGEDTMVPKDARYKPIIGNAKDATKADWMKINREYDCPADYIKKISGPDEPCNEPGFSCVGGSKCEKGMCHCPHLAYEGHCIDEFKGCPQPSFDGAYSMSYSRAKPEYQMVKLMCNDGSDVTLNCNPETGKYKEGMDISCTHKTGGGSSGGSTSGGSSGGSTSGGSSGGGSSSTGGKCDRPDYTKLENYSRIYSERSGGGYVKVECGQSGTIMNCKNGQWVPDRC